MNVNIGDMRNVSSLLDLINRISMGRRFAPPPDKDPEADERVIGSLNDEEKAQWTAWELIRKECSALADRIPDNTVPDPLGKEIMLLVEWHDAMAKFFWANIVGRFIDALTDLNLDNVVIRSGYRIVSSHTVPVVWLQDGKSVALH